MSDLLRLTQTLNDRLVLLERMAKHHLPRQYSRNALAKRVGTHGSAITKLIRSGVIKAPSEGDFTESEFNAACAAFYAYKATMAKARQYEPPVPVSVQEMLDAKRQACEEASRQSAGYSGSIRRRFYASVRSSILNEIAKSGGPCIWMCGNRAASGKSLCSNCQREKVDMRHRKEAERDSRRAAHGKRIGESEAENSGTGGSGQEA